jgi:hypothetical protein
MTTNTFRKPTPILCAMLVLLPSLISCEAPKPEVPAESPKVSKTQPPPAYPVKVSANRRYLVDQNNVPFLMVGDTPQGLISRLSEKEADDYFADRQAHGFNTMGWIDVACAGRDYPSNVHAETPDGIRPFTKLFPGGTDYTHYDLSSPNEAYFARLDHIVESAAKHGILVFIDPAETAGWLPVLRRNGLAAASAYGQYLGNRYKKFSNVAWLNGNDFGQGSREGHQVRRPGADSNRRIQSADRLLIGRSVMVGAGIDQWRLRIRSDLHSNVAQLQPDARNAGLPDGSAL